MLLQILNTSFRGQATSIIRGKTTKDLIVYSNNGDSYAYTILYYKKKYCIAGIADILEENPSQYKWLE